MGQAYVQLAENYTSAHSSGWTIYAYLGEVTATNSTFTLPAFSQSVGYWTGAAKDRAKAYFGIGAFTPSGTCLGTAIINFLSGPLSDNYYSWPPGAWVSGTTSDSISGATAYTSWFFSSANPTAKTATIIFKYVNPYLTSSDSSNSLWNRYYDGSGVYVGMSGGTTVTLNAPPTFTIPSSVTLNPTSYTYKNYTSASVTVSAPYAQYGGYITKIKFQIGSQYVENTYTSSSQPSSSGVTLTLNPLNIVGEDLVPTVTVTDSRGQVTTKTLNKITVKEYQLPTASIIDVEHVNSDGTPNDEGLYALAKVQFSCTKDGVSNLISPTVALKNSDGTAVSGFTPAFTWYTTRNDSTHKLSGSVTWSSVISGQVLYLRVGSNLNPNNTYQLQITPRDTDVKSVTRSGTMVTNVVPAAFFTIDILAGGHGITFGGPAKTTGFRCEMPTIIANSFKLDLTEVDDTTSDDYKLNQAISDLSWTSAVIES